MSKETSLEGYREFEKEDAKRFASPKPLVFSMVATYAVAGLYAIGETGLLSHVITSPEGIIPVALVNGAAAISFVRSVRKRKNLEKITKRIAREEERALLPDFAYERFRAKSILRLSRFISQSRPETVDFKITMVSVMDTAHKTARVLADNKPVKVPDKRSGETVGDVLQQEQEAEVARIIATSSRLAMPSLEKYSGGQKTSGTQLSDTIGIINQNLALK